MEIRHLHDLNPAMVSAAGHQCQLKVDYSKPTRLYSDIPGITDFGQVGWPQVDANDWYMGPLPRCEHVYYDKSRRRQTGRQRFQR